MRLSLYHLRNTGLQRPRRRTLGGVSFVGSLVLRLQSEARVVPEQRAALEHELAACWEALVSTKPELTPRAVGFADHAARVLLSAADAEVSVELVRATLWPDLALAYLALCGDEAALGDVVRRVRAVAQRVAARGGGPDADELLFVLEGKLFDPEDSKLLGYSGLGDLDGWLSVMATRAWLNLRRDRGKEQLTSTSQELDATWLEGSGVRVDAHDPELSYLKQLYRAEFRAAFERAASSLSAEERNLLRASFGEGLSIDAIAASRGVHRATAARRVNHAKERLLSETRRLLVAELSLSRSDLESVMRLIQSQLHLTLSRVFARAESEP